MYFIKINSPSCLYMFLGAAPLGAGGLGAVKEGAKSGSEEVRRRVAGSGGGREDDSRDRGWKPGASRRPDLRGAPQRRPESVDSWEGRGEAGRVPTPRWTPLWASWTSGVASVVGCSGHVAPLTTPPPGVTHSCGLAPGSCWTRRTAFRKPPDGPVCTPHPGRQSWRR